MRVVGDADVGFAEGNALGFLVGVRLGANVGLLVVGVLDGLLVGWGVVVGAELGLLVVGLRWRGHHVRDVGYKQF